MQRLTGVRRRERNARRWRLKCFQWIYEGTGPRYALLCFVTHVETRSPPVFFMRYDAKLSIRSAVVLIVSEMGPVRPEIKALEASHLNSLASLDVASTHVYVPLRNGTVRVPLKTSSVPR